MSSGRLTSVIAIITSHDARPLPQPRLTRHDRAKYESTSAIIIIPLALHLIRLRAPLSNPTLPTSRFEWLLPGRLSPEHTNHGILPPASASYPACVKLRKSSALAPTFVFLPKMQPSSLALKAGG